MKKLHFFKGRPVPAFVFLAAFILVGLVGGVASVTNAAPAVTNVTAQLNPGYRIVVDGVQQNFFNSSGSQVYPLVYNNTTYLPLRAIGELMNKNVNWDEASLTVSLSGTRTTAPTTGRVVAAQQQYVSAQLRPDFTIMLDGVRRSFSNSDGSYVYPLLYNGSVYLPLRAIGELMGKNVDWNDQTSTVTLSGGSVGGTTVTDADSFGSSTNQNQTQTPVQNQTQGTMLTTDQANAIALQQVPGATSSNITKTKKEYDDGRWQYEVDIYYNYTEYDIKLDAYTGTILGMDMEKNTVPTTQTNTSQPQMMTNDEARAAALRNVPGATMNNVTKLKFEYDDGRAVYEVDIYYNFTEYEMKIDAYTGEVLDLEVDKDDYFYRQAHHSGHHGYVSNVSNAGYAGYSNYCGYCWR